MRLEGAHVLVTGGSRGIGAELARQLAARGARVTAVARSEGGLEHLLDELRAGDASGTDRDVGYVVADLASARGREGLVGRVEADRGPVDILVNNAGMPSTGDFAKLSAGDLERTVALNLLAPMELARQAIPGMLARDRGHIVSMSSVAGAASFPGAVPYCATKAGLTHFTAALRTELKGTSIGTTVVEVGFVASGVREEMLDYEPAKRAYERVQRLHVMPDTPISLLCRATVDAIEDGHRHVRYPGRIRGMLLLSEAPRRLVELVYAGVRTRP